MSDLEKTIKAISRKDSLLDGLSPGRGRKELFELIEQIPEEMIPQAHNLLANMLHCDKELDQLHIQIDIRRKQIDQLIQELDQESDQININIILEKQYRGRKRPRKEVELMVGGLIDSLNNDIRTFNVLSSFKALFNSTSLPLIPKMDQDTASEN